MDGIIFDVDGVIFQGNTLISGSKDILPVLKDAGIPYRFIINTTCMAKNAVMKSILVKTKKISQRISGKI